MPHFIIKETEKRIVITFKTGRLQRWICGSGGTSDRDSATVFKNVFLARAHLNRYGIKRTPSFKFEEI